MNEKKVVGRNVAIALGIMCIILAVGLVGAIANYTSIISEKDNTITSLNSQITDKDNTISSLNSQIASKDSQISSLNSQIANLTNQVNDLNNTITTKDSQIQTLQEWLDGNETLLSQLQTWLVGNKTYYESEIAALYAQITALTAPKLIEVHLMSDDNRPLFGTPYLHVYGYVCNVGTYTAYNSKIHVVLYQRGGVIAKDTYITLGAISGESWTSVDSNIYYSGDALVSWTLTLEWTS